VPADVYFIITSIYSLPNIRADNRLVNAAKGEGFEEIKPRK